jgi:hypothetical protein
MNLRTAATVRSLRPSTATRVRAERPDAPPLNRLYFFSYANVAQEKQR